MSSSSDSFLQKTSEELSYLVQHPELYHATLVAEAGRELRRRGVALPHPQGAEPAAAASVSAAHAYEEPASSSLGRWWPAGLIAAAVAGLAWWGLRDSTATSTAVAAKPVSTEPIVLEAVKTDRMPDFEAETARQVATTRRQLSAQDRADTTATGRYSRMARRYWLAENAAAYLTKQAAGKKVPEVFPGQVTIALERITWFMKAKAYNQALTPAMEEHLQLMQQGLVLRRNSLKNLKTRYETYGETYLDRDLNRADFEASDIGGELLGQPSKRAPMQGKISDL
ncbi:hypothetical protein ACFPAF_12460 [Hymenobacter endophyticus]|uniref:Uncharacterized protein n=1 Tax=Hymenobacter endophyticus TaxID=3076335 RepID=A0ABU3TIM4_9BACT|nr:hypothetical protein [Hymenobacter endophyticus]MDU0371211.1 hypothetical protein [Hymenobacter endophyticus]